MRVGTIIAILFLSQLLLPSTSYAEDRFNVCSADNGKIITECPRFCETACRDINFVERSGAIRDACRAAINLPEARRLDGQKCVTIAGRLSDARPVAADFKAAACIQAARNSLSLADKLQRIRNEKVRKLLQERYQDFPTCAPEPAALFAMAGCIADGTEELRAYYKELEQRVSRKPGQPTGEFCQSAVKMFEDDTYDRLQKAEQYATFLAAEFNSMIVSCAADMRNWLLRRGEQQSASNDPATGQSLSEMKKTMDDQLQSVGQAEGQIDNVLREINRSGKQITANLDRAVFECPLPKERLR